MYRSNTGNNSNSDSITVLTLINVILDTTADNNATPKLLVSGDGGANYFTAPHTFQWVPGSAHTIVTQTPQTSGTTYTWVRWSDSGAISHSVSPSSSTTITAAFAGVTSLGGFYGTNKTGPIGGNRVWPVNIGNNGPGVAFGARVTNLTVVQTSGTACSPTVVSTMPVIAGDIAPGGTLAANVTINFTNCFSNAQFKVTANLSANGVAATGTILKLNQLQ